MKQLTINGDLFTFKRLENVANGKTDIFDLYEKPSEEKRKAFKKWEAKLDSIHGLIGGSHNFSIFGKITDEEGIRHTVKITKCNNFIID